MRIVILGAGGMGSLYGGLLADQIGIKASRAEDLDGVADLLVLFTKTYHSASALESARHLIGPETWLMSIQNGLGAVDRLMAYGGLDRIIIGMSSFPADFVGPGHIESHQGGFSETALMAANDGECPAAVVQISEYLSRAGLNCAVDPLVQQAIWKKVAFNCALNSLCAICKDTPGIIGQDQSSRSFALNVVSEVVAVAGAAGFAISGVEVAQMVDRAIDKHADHKPSMRQDLEAGRQTEVDALNGAVVSLGQELGVPTPLNESLWRLVKLAERSR